MQAISAHYQLNNIRITFVCTQGFANYNIKNTKYGCYIFQYSNHGHLTLVHIFSNSYFVTCSTPPKLKDSHHGRYHQSPPGHSSTERTTSLPPEVRLKLRLMQRACMVHWPALRDSGLEHGWKCKSSQVFPLLFSWLWNHLEPLKENSYISIFPRLWSTHFLLRSSGSSCNFKYDPHCTYQGVSMTQGRV